MLTFEIRHYIRIKRRGHRGGCRGVLAYGWDDEAGAASFGGLISRG